MVYLYLDRVCQCSHANEILLLSIFTERETVMGISAKIFLYGRYLCKYMHVYSLSCVPGSQAVRERCKGKKNSTPVYGPLSRNCFCSIVPCLYVFSPLSNFIKLRASTCWTFMHTLLIHWLGTDIQKA